MKIIVDGKELEIPRGGGPSQDIYSTEETRIGTWIDGKPLYRRVIQATSPRSIVQTAQHISSLGYAVNLIECSAVITQSSGMQVPLPVAYDNNFYASVLDIRPNGDIYMGVYHNNYVNRPVTIILKYTKTTDQATVLTEMADKIVETNFTPTAAVTATHTELHTEEV